MISVSAVFACTVKERAPWFGQMHTGTWLTGSSLKFARNWFREGAFNDGFLLLRKPRSIESQDIQARSLYTSYPPGVILPIHAIAKLTDTEPSPKMVMAYNLFIHFMISLSFAFISFLTASRLGLGKATTYFYSILPSVFYLLAPISEAYHQNRYFADMAVLFPFAAVLFLETLFAVTKLSSRTRRIFAIVQHCFFALGLLTDYLFVFIYAAVFIKRAALREMGHGAKELILRSALFCISGIVSAGLFLFQIVKSGAFDEILKTFIFRIGADEKGARYALNFYARFWKKHFAGTMGDVGIFLIFFCAACIASAVILLPLLKRKKKIQAPNLALSLLGLNAVTVFSCIAQVYFLDNHSAIHNFSALKMVFVTAIVPFSLFWLWLISMSPRLKAAMTDSAVKIPWLHFKGRRFSIPVFPALLGVFFVVYLNSIHGNYQKLIDKKPGRIEEIGYFIDEHTGYEDVVFSDRIKVDFNPPMIPALSMKLVYKVKKLRQMFKKVKRLPDEATINFLVDKKKNPDASPLGGDDFWKGAARAEQGNLVLLKLDKKEFVSRYRRDAKALKKKPSSKKKKNHTK